MFESSSPFGASNPSPFGAPAATNPFGSNSNPFGTNAQANNPFGAKPFGSTTPAFGAQTGSSLFGSGTSTGVIGATAAPAFGASSSAFGASSTTPAFGAFGQQKPASPFGGFGATQPQANPFGSPSYGQSQPAFGSQAFGSTTPAFGAQSTPAFGSTTTPLFGSSTPAFGSSSTPAFGASTTPAFGASSTSAFGATSAPAFGASPSTPAFGAFGGSSVFGQSAPAFGATTTPAFGSTPAASPFGASSGSAFGSTFGTSTFGASTFGGQQQQRVGTRVAPYAPTNDTDVGVGAQAGKFMMCISAMPAYKDKQLEELWPNPASTSLPAAGGLFGQPAPAASSPFGSSTATFGQASTPNPFASTSTTNPFGATKPAFGSLTPSPAFGTAASTPAFGTSTFGTSTNPFGAAPTPAFGQASSSPAFGSTPSPFGQTSAPAFGSSTFGSTGSSLFGQSTPAFGSSSPAFGAATSTPAFGAQTTSAFGGTSLFGNTESSGGSPFGTSTPAFGASPGPAFGQTQASFGSIAFGNTSTPGSLFGQTKPAGLTQSTPSLFGGFGLTTPAGQTSSAFSFPRLRTPQPGAITPFGGTQSTFGVQNTFGQQQTAQNVMQATPTPVANPFGTLPAMPQITIGRSAGSGPSVQYGISSMLVSEKPSQVRVNTSLTPRHITQRSKLRMHARRYHPKKDGPKVSFFSDGEEAPSTPKADVMFVPRENQRSLFIRQPEPFPISPSAAKSLPDVREIATPVQKDDVPLEETVEDPEISPPPFSFPESPQTNWRSPDNGNSNGTVENPPVGQAKSSERPASKPVPKSNGFQQSEVNLFSELLDVFMRTEVQIESSDNDQRSPSPSTSHHHQQAGATTSTASAKVNTRAESETHVVTEMLGKMHVGGEDGEAKRKATKLAAKEAKQKEKAKSKAEQDAKIESMMKLLQELHRSRDNRSMSQADAKVLGEKIDIIQEKIGKLHEKTDKLHDVSHEIKTTQVHSKQRRVPRIVVCTERGVNMKQKLLTKLPIGIRAVQLHLLCEQPGKEHIVADATGCEINHMIGERWAKLQPLLATGLQLVTMAVNVGGAIAGLGQIFPNLGRNVWDTKAVDLGKHSVQGRKTQGEQAVADALRVAQEEESAAQWLVSYLEENEVAIHEAFGLLRVRYKSNGSLAWLCSEHQTQGLNDGILESFPVRR